tara:strand:+ start:627 stop:755 length:129 start_codon:yes stop_codon:yes gene_type:complete
MTTSDKLLLDIGSVYKQLGDGASIPVSGDAPDTDIALNNQVP